MPRSSSRLFLDINDQDGGFHQCESFDTGIDIVPSYGVQDNRPVGGSTVTIVPIVRFLGCPMV